MSEASKALAEVRGWLCDNLDASEAGHVCGMLSVVSRRVVRADELESENAKLRELVVGFWQALKGDTQDCPFVICEYMYECSDDECIYERMLQDLGIEVSE